MPELTLPLGGAATYRGMTGREEDLLTNRKKWRSGDAIDELIANCTTSLKGKDKVGIDDVRGLQTPDRMALLLAIRRESLGDEMHVTLHDAENTPFHVAVDLSQLEYIEAPEGFQPDTPFETTLDVGGEAVTVRFSYMTGHHERIVAKADDAVTMAMLTRISSVQGVHNNDKKNWLRDLPIRQRGELRKAMELMECGPQMRVKADDPNGNEVEFSVLEQSSFFFPSD